VTKKKASRQNRVFEFPPLCEERAVEADMGTTVLIKGRVVYKDNLK